MKKILVLASTYPRWKNDAEPGFVKYLCSELARHYEVHILAPHYAKANVYELVNGIHIHRYRYCLSSLETLAYEGGILSNLKKNKFNYLLIPPFVIFQFISILSLNRKYRFNLMHAHWLVPQGLLSVLARFYSRSKYQILTTSHGSDLYALKGRLMTRIKGWVIKQSDHTTVVSRAMKDYCHQLGFDVDKISICSMGVDLKNTFTSRTMFSERSGLVFVGRLIENKGLVYLIDAMKIICQKNPTIHLNIVGNGPDKRQLEKQVYDIGLTENIIFTGSIPNHEVPKYLNKSKIAIMPSIISKHGEQEGLGLVAIEAMGCGCAVIASDLPGIRDVVSDGKTGLMVKPASSQALADATLKLYENNDLMESIARNGRNFVLQNFDWEKIGEKYSSIISNL